VALVLSQQGQRDIFATLRVACEIRRYTHKLSDNQVGDRLHTALEAVGIDEGETIRGNTALVEARQTLSLLKQGPLIAAARNSDDVSVMMNQPIVPPLDWIDSPKETAPAQRDRAEAVGKVPLCQLTGPITRQPANGFRLGTKILIRPAPK
jgi:hypothetical protein